MTSLHEPRVKRVIAIGASNLSLGAGSLRSAVSGYLGPMTDVKIIGGYGRSFGTSTRVLGKPRPSLADSIMCHALDELHRPSSKAVITDVGNDLMYGIAPALLIEWLRHCLVQVQQYANTVLLVDLPIAALEELSPTRYLLARSVLFPGSRISLDTGMARAVEVSNGVQQLACRPNTRYLAPPRAWYGIDPFHIRRTKRKAAWAKIVEMAIA